MFSVTCRNFLAQRRDAAPAPLTPHPSPLTQASPSTALISSSTDSYARLAFISQIWQTCSHMRSDLGPRPRAASQPASQPAVAYLRHHSLCRQEPFFFFSLTVFFRWMVMQQHCSTRRNMRVCYLLVISGEETFRASTVRTLKK